jgi:excisionase family DNA binding protein
MEPLLHARLEAAQILCISVRKLDLLIKQRALKAVKIGRRTLISHSELKQFAKRATDASQLGHRDAE